MTGSNAFLRTLVVFGLGLFILGGCASSPKSRFYLLQSYVPAGKTEVAVSTADGAVYGIGPVRLPEYLDRPQIVTRTGRNELQLAEYDRWGEPLKDSFNRVLIENLAALLPSNAVIAFPWPKSAHVKYQVMAEVTRFDGVSGRQVQLFAQWSVMDMAANKAVVTKKTAITTPVSAAGYESLVAAQNEALGEFSAEIAAALKSLPD